MEMEVDVLASKPQRDWMCGVMYCQYQVRRGAGGLSDASQPDPSALTRAEGIFTSRPQPMATRGQERRLTREREHCRGAFIGRHS
jgi:hypothetical protein